MSQKKQQARVILVGDYRQHSSIEAEDSFRLIEQRLPRLVSCTFRKSPFFVVRGVNYRRTIELGRTLERVQVNTRCVTVTAFSDKKQLLAISSLRSF